MHTAQKTPENKSQEKSESENQLESFFTEHPKHVCQWCCDQCNLVDRSNKMDWSLLTIHCGMVEPPIHRYVSIHTISFWIVPCDVHYFLNSWMVLATWDRSLQWTEKLTNVSSLMQVQDKKTQFLRDFNKFLMLDMRISVSMVSGGHSLTICYFCFWPSFYSSFRPFTIF